MDLSSFAARLGLLSINRFRATILFLFLILIGGFTAYSSLLPRDGFPDLAFPVVFVQTRYEGGTIQQINNEVTQPIEQIVLSVDGVESVDSQTFPGSSFISINFKTEVDVLDAADRVEDALAVDLALPNGIEAVVSPLETDAFEGANLLLVLGHESESDETIQAKAEEVAQEFIKLEEVDDAFAFSLIETVYNPSLDAEVEVQSTFNRLGLKQGEEVQFYNSILVGIRNNDTFTASEISDAVQQKIAQVESRMLSDVGYVIDTVFDQGESLDEEIGALEGNALFALTAVALVLILFVNWKASIIGVIFIPTVMAGTFLTMLLVGISINVISLFGLILVLGLLVDDAIVVVESIDYFKKQGYKGKKAIRKALRTIGKADIIGTITTLLVFFPMLLIVGFLGDIIEDIPLTVIITLIISLLSALTFVPLLSRLLIQDQDEKDMQKPLARVLNAPTNGLIALGEYVGRFIKWYLSKWYYLAAVVIISFGLIMTGMATAGQSDIVNFPAEKDSDGLSATITYDPTLSIEERESIAIEFENDLVSLFGEYIEDVQYQQVGRNFFGQQVAEITVGLTDFRSRDIRAPEIAEQLSAAAGPFQQATVSVIAESLGGPPQDEFPSRIQVFAQDLSTLESISSEVINYLNELELPGGAEIDKIEVRNLDFLAKRDGQRFAEIATSFNADGDDATVQFISTQVNEEFDADRLAAFGVGEEAVDTDLGFASEILESVISAGIALMASFVVMYIFLSVVFNSFGRGFLIMLGVPFSFFGLFVGLYLTNNPISFFVLIGIIALVGIVVNNTVMLLDYANQRRDEGMNIVDAIVGASKVRFRPLLTTSVTTIVGLLPLALFDPFWESLAFSIIFGLASSTFMVIFVFPAYYFIIEHIRAWKSRQVVRFRKG